LRPGVQCPDRRRTPHQSRDCRLYVTSILRKLGVTSRVQAAALVESAGLLDSPQP
jgi:hypothetical protein